MAFVLSRDERTFPMARLVVVALVPVAFVKVRFWRVVEPETVTVDARSAVVVAFPSIITEPENKPLPCTESANEGEVVPRPRNPVALMTFVKEPEEP